MGKLDFQEVPAHLRATVIPPRRELSPLAKALVAGKTLKIAKVDRGKVGGINKTLKTRGLRLRQGMINESEILLWTEKIDDSPST